MLDADDRRKKDADEILQAMNWVRRLGAQVGQGPVVCTGIEQLLKGFTE